MTLLIIGLVLWTLAHLLKRAAPGARAALGRSLGAGQTRGVIAFADRARAGPVIIGYRAGRRSAGLRPAGLGDPRQ